MFIIRPDQFDTAWIKDLPCQRRSRGNPRTRQKRRYKDIITAFDIETTRIPEIEQSVMFVWQWCFGDRCTVVGRTWSEFLDLRARIESELKPDEFLVVWDHNLSFEFAFFRGIWHFDPGDVFPIRPRKILKCYMGRVEFRCSYLHSNMSLGEYLDKMQTVHRKLSGKEFDYTKTRWPWTPLSESELAYACNDVIGLVEAVTIEMQHDGDDLYTIPLTSTGYVRRDAKRAMREVSWTFLHDQLPDWPLFEMLREAFRGGDTHANRFYAGQTVEDVHSADRSSSYPDCQCNCPYPVSTFFRDPRGRLSMTEVMDLITIRKKAVLMRCAISGLELRDPYWPVPYLSRDKCRQIIKGDFDNGRILAAQYLEVTLTDIDLRIIAREYTWSDIVFYDVAYARYGKLPEPLLRETIRYYRAKTELKGVPGQEIYYTKAKNKLNSIYGMMAQNPVKRSILFETDGVLDKTGQIDYYPEDTSKTDPDLLEESKRRAFVCYQWGCWTTAWARFRLRQGIWLVLDQGGEFLYCDTDSVKYLGDVDWSSYNAERIRDSTQSGAFATDPAGIVHYMGVFEAEHDMDKFRTLGAKKYVYTYGGRLYCTIAGVGKTAGGKALEAAGGIEAFKTGFVFDGEAGGLEAIYNDDPAVKTWTVDGRTLEITSNVTLRPSTYTVGLAADYDRLLRNLHYTIDF